MPKDRDSSDPTPSRADVVAACVRDRSPAGATRTWATTHTLFCDETGNSGSNFNDPAQPLYVEGGWFVAHDRRLALEATFSEIERSYAFGPKTKGTNLKGSPRGQRYIAAALEMVSRDATPFFYLVEKRYFICAKAVETFFDPNYNPAVDPMETFDPGVRKERADLLYSAPDVVVRAFGEAFRQEDPARVAAAGAAWVEVLTRQREGGLAAQLKLCLPNIGANISSEFQKLREAGLPRGYATLNAPSLAQVFQLIENAGPPCDLLHDQCDTFTGIYQHFFDLFRNARIDVLPRLDGTREVFGFTRLNALKFGDSESLPLLRAADYLVAAGVEFAKCTLAKQEISSELRDCAFHGMARMMAEAVGIESRHPAVNRQIGEIMASDSWIARVAGEFHRS